MLVDGLRALAVCQLARKNHLFQEPLGEITSHGRIAGKENSTEEFWGLEGNSNCL